MLGNELFFRLVWTRPFQPTFLRVTDEDKKYETPLYSSGTSEK